MDNRVRYAIVGAGGRHELYRDALIGAYASSAVLTGLCDNNQGRAALSAGVVRARTGVDAPIYAAENFDAMIDETRPDWVIVTTKDSLHDRYICRALELGRNVVAEKPMTIDAERCAVILETQRRTGKQVRVVFNYRYSPLRTQIKHLLMSGLIGEVISLDFHWMLDLRHGADYFRRWHRNKEHSGGLLVHKATHHFDLENWWINAVPAQVFASGRRAFYTPDTAERLGLRGRGARCHGCGESEQCPYYLSLRNNESLRALYLDQEGHDGYYRDRCVFSEEIDIEDSMTLTVRYSTGARMSYSLNAFAPWEGYVIAFNGTRGRLEHKCEESVHINADGSAPDALKREGSWIRVYPHFESAYEIPIWEASGSHGGGDELMLQDLFGEASEADVYGRRADHLCGAWSIVTGIAANQSIATGRPVDVKHLIPGLEATNTGTGPLSASPSRQA